MIRPFFLVLFFSGCVGKNDTNDGAIAACRQTNDSLKAVIKLLTVPDYEGPNIAEASYYFHPFDQRLLRVQGLSRPDTLFLSELRQHPELIPDTAVLGGTMYFEWAKPIGTKWVLAQYSDGHVQGKALYAYKADRNGRISWKLLDKYLD